MGMPIKRFAVELGRLLPGFIKEMARRQMPAVAKANITIQQVIALEYLTIKKQAIMSELARYIGVTLSAVTGLIDRMVNAKLVSRYYDEKDSRIIIIKPTRKGRGIADDIKRRRHKFIMSTFSKLSEEDRGNYLRIITKVYSILLKTKR